MNDIRFALRQLAKEPGFTLVAGLTLGLGIGACAAIFSVVNGVLLRPPPFPEPDRVVTVRQSVGASPETASLPAGMYLAWRQARSFEGVGTLNGASYNLTGGGQPLHLYAARMTASLLPTFRISPALGRNFRPEEELTYGSENVAILSHRLWQRRFGGRLEVVGQVIQMNGRPFTVVGVMPAESPLPERVEIFTPRGFLPGEPRNLGYPTDLVFGRLKPGVTAAEARAELTLLANRAAEAMGPRRGVRPGWSLTVNPMMESIVGKVRPVLVSLLGAVAFLLLIACANVANLMLARAAGRSTEMAVRAAIGASRARLLRQLLVESLMLSLLGGVAGLAIAWGGVQALLALAPEALPRAAHIAVDGRALALTFLLVVLTGVGFGLAPAFQASRVQLGDALKQAGRGPGGGQRQRLRGALVVAEVATALVLLAGAGLLMRSFARLQQVDPGFDPRHTHVVESFLPRPQYAKPAQYTVFAERAMAAIAARPGAQVVAVTSNLPFSDHHMTAEFATAFTIPGQPLALDQDLPKAAYYAVSPGYFRAMGIPLVRGRAFHRGDHADAAEVAIVNASLAARFFPGQEAVGKAIKFQDKPSEIVGVVADVKHDSLEAEGTLQIYQPFAQMPDNDIIYIVRAAPGADAGMAEAVRAAVASVDPQVPLYNARPLAAAVGASMARQRFAMTLFAVFSGMALVLAAIGIYGVMSYSVSTRTGEIGIRMALGARAQDVMRMVLVQGGRMVVLGVLAGVVGAALLTRFLDKLLFGISTRDPLTFVVAIALLTATAGVACLLPARRATSVAPMRALRSD